MGRRELAIVLLSIVVFALLLSLTFFTERTVHNGVTTVAFQNWVGILFVLCVLGLAFACFSIRTKNSRFGWAGTIFCILGLILLGPTFFTHHIRTDGKEFIVQSGLSFNREIHKINFDDIIKIDLIRKKYRKWMKNYAVMRLKDGTEDELELDNILMTKGGAEIFLEQIRGKSIPVNDLRKK